jgi:probable F420-dependent oxidoreductase
MNRIGIHLYNRGPLAKRALITETARIADSLPIDDCWVFDHIAIPPDQSQGSNGHYVEPLTTLAYVAGLTTKLCIGTRVLILPYRPAYLIAKWAASLQELSGGRFRMGCGVGWLDAEFRVVGVDKKKRGALTDAALETIHKCFASDEVEIDGVRVLFRPRPPRPAIYVGGAPPHALERAVRWADGWMPGPTDDPEKLRAPIAELRRLAAAAGKPAPEVVFSAALPLDDADAARAKIAQLEDIGVTQFGLYMPYETGAEFAQMAEALVRAAGRQ